MYSTCLFCKTSLGANQIVEELPIGRRVAFDARRGRLWVVCPRCARWNLTPFEERWEAIERCEREYRATPTRISTDNIGLARHREGLELVRIGDPLRPEFAAWRYSPELTRRRRRSDLLRGAGRVTALGAAGVALAAFTPIIGAGLVAVVVLPPITLGAATLPILGVLAARDYMADDREIARFGYRSKIITVRAVHLDAARLFFDEGRDLRLRLRHDTGVAELSGQRAGYAAATMLASSNHTGGDAQTVADAVERIVSAGSVERFLAETTRRAEARFSSPLRAIGRRNVGALGLAPTERLAVEMAVHEEAERMAMEGELALLEDAWREAEEVAAIADGELTPLAR